MNTPQDTGRDGQLMTLLAAGLEFEASDLHLVAGYPPTYRIHGLLRNADESVLTGDDAERMIVSIMPPQLRAKFDQQRDFDFSLSLERSDAALARFRVNVFHHQGTLGACFRYVPGVIPSFEWMGFPADLAQRIAHARNGLVLITGVTGSGKTTTLAGIVDLLNADGHRRIVTVEEPVEYLFQPKAHSIITQREVGVDVDNFADGLKFGLRQDPDVILCGEVRDLATARMAISAAETGHLVLTTVHTQDAKGAVTRLIDIFPADRQQDVRGQLSLSLRFVVTQHLLPSIDPGQKRVLAIEVLAINDAARAAIRLNKIESIDTIIQTGKKLGMQTLDEDLGRLVRERRISPDTARRYAKNPDGLVW